MYFVSNDENKAVQSIMYPLGYIELLVCSKTTHTFSMDDNLHLQENYDYLPMTLSDIE